MFPECSPNGLWSLCASCILRQPWYFCLSASCSWDGGSRASAQLKPSVPRMFPEHPLLVRCGLLNYQVN
jgi:hypothetical protein